MFDLLKSTEKKRRKKKYKYIVVEQKLKGSENKVYNTYGIKLKGEAYIINDVTCNQKEANEIVYKLNRYQADPIHFYDCTIENLIRVKKGTENLRCLYVNKNSLILFAALRFIDLSKSVYISIVTSILEWPNSP